VILSGYGISLDLPDPWEGEIFKLEPDPPALIFPIVHAASFGALSNRDSYGDGIVLQMDGYGAFIALVEYSSEMLTRGGFAQPSLPLPIQLEQLSTTALNTPAANLLGFQYLFHMSERPFSLQIVLGSLDDVEESLSVVNQVLGSLSVLSASESPRLSNSAGTP
jgi:hypothetical protein